jgi:ketosteroid isomerase-like protein
LADRASPPTVTSDIAKGPAKMTDAISVVSRLLDAHNRRDAERLAEHYAPGATVHMAEWPEPITASAWIGATAQLVESFPDLMFMGGRVATGDSVVMFEIRITGTNDGPLHLNPLATRCPSTAW